MKAVKDPMLGYLEYESVADAIRKGASHRRAHDALRLYIDQLEHAAAGYTMNEFMNHLERFFRTHEHHLLVEFHGRVPRLTELVHKFDPKRTSLVIERDRRDPLEEGVYPALSVILLFPFGSLSFENTTLPLSEYRGEQWIIVHDLLVPLHSSPLLESAAVQLETYELGSLTEDGWDEELRNVFRLAGYHYDDMSDQDKAAFTEALANCERPLIWERN